MAAHLDELYAGALYLEAGDREAAGDLLVQALLLARGSLAEGDPGDPRAWFDERLVHTFLGRARGGAASSDPDVAAEPRALRTAPHSLGLEMEAEQILSGFGTLPPRIRSTMWLVIVRRWAYGEVARALGVDRSRIAEWVRQGHRSMHRAGADRRGRSRAGGESDS